MTDLDWGYTRPRVEEYRPKKKQITIRQYIDAIKQNGYPQIFGMGWHTDNGRIIGACAYGQAVLNLGLGSFESDTHGILARTIELNDRHKLPLDKIAEMLEKEYRNYMDEPLVGTERDFSYYLGMK